MNLPGAAKYYTTVELSEDSLEALRWWKDFLAANPGAATCRNMTSNGLLLKWGDGSGTGTGFTSELCPIEESQDLCPNIELWMGVW